jgi:hypothetical protein
MVWLKLGPLLSALLNAWKTFEEHFHLIPQNLKENETKFNE